MALTYRDIDNVLRRLPGTTAISVSVSDFGALLAISEPNASLPSHKKHIEYSPKVPVQTQTNIRPSANIMPGDIVVT